eukprot:Gregarina_sp_Poly_1__3196@NODE_190_length_11648_cov_127_353855_g169_i0_p2_GENE_NODE_190_length_11648_cov_127_353855_g169_i0NODE_190_length_11648_cov_127_353855_g169_i0_p2_ORF_typecomplete_len778_score58_96KAP/PF05804_12/0_28_NODE_190_length_11648_cov_127_353855_g169_i028745207
MNPVIDEQREPRRRRLNNSASSSCYAKIWNEGIPTRNSLTITGSDWNPFWSPPNGHYNSYSDDEEPSSAVADSESSSSEDAVGSGLPNQRGALLSGYQGRRALVSHWESCVQECRDGNTAAADWRESQTFSNPFAKAMMELIRFLFCEKECVPTTLIHLRLLSFMLSRYQSNLSRLEKVLDASPPNHSDFFRGFSNGLQKLKSICQELFSICDLPAAKFMLDQTLSLVFKVAALMTKHGMSTSQCSVHMYVATDNDDTKKRNLRLLYSYSRSCRCQHLSSDLCQILSGWNQPNLCFIQNYAEQSRCSDVQREYYLLRPDRLLIKLLMIVLNENVWRNTEPSKNVQTLSGAATSTLSELVELVGSCSTLYVMVKWTLMLLIRLSINKERKLLCSVSEPLESICLDTATRPTPVESVFHSESCVTHEDLILKSGCMKQAMQMLLESLGRSTSLNQVAISLLLCFCVLCRRRGLLDHKTVENLPGNVFLVSFVDRYVSMTIPSLSVKAVRRSAFTSSSPPKTSPHTATIAVPYAPMTMRQFLLHKLPVTSLTLSDQSDRHLHKFSNQLNLVQFICGINSYEFITGVIQGLLEQNFVAFSASTLQSEIRQETTILVKLVVFAIGSSSLLGLTALRAFPCFTSLLACQGLLHNMDPQQMPYEDYNPQTCFPGQVRKSSNLSGPAQAPSEKTFSLEKLLETIVVHSNVILNPDECNQLSQEGKLPPEIGILKSLVPQNWLPYLGCLGACMVETEDRLDAVSLVKEFLRLVQEIYNKTCTSTKV